MEVVMAHRSKLLILAAAFVLAGGILMIGCARNDVAPNAPSVSVNGEVQATLPSRAIPADARVLVAAIAAQDRATPGLLRVQGVVGTGASADAAGRPIVVVYTERPGVAGLPRMIDGYAVRVHVTGKVVAYGGPPGGGGTLKMGTSTGNDLECASGTLGCVVIKGGNEFFLSNNHVFARENDASNGERIDAPGRYDGKPVCSQTPQCANLSDFQPISFTSDNTIDAAIAAPSAGRAYTQVTSSGYDPSSTPVTGAVGLAVKKTGRTSKLTHGTIEAVNVTINVQYSGGVARFVGQYQMGGSFIRSGDSGSLMVTETGANPVGLCFAGGGGASFANPIGPVLQRFSATVK